MRVPPVISHETAARLWGLDVLDPSVAEHVTVARNHAAPVDGYVTHRANLAAADIVELHGERVTSPLRTVLDIARYADRPSGLVVADCALRLQICSAGELRRAVAGARGPGAGRVRWVANEARAGAGSPLESVTRVLFREARIGPLSLQVRLEPGGHPYDFGIDGAATLVETDGWEHHREYPRFEQDCTQIVTAAVRDYVVLRFTWWQVRERRRGWSTRCARSWPASGRPVAAAPRSTRGYRRAS